MESGDKEELNWSPEMQKLPYCEGFLPPLGFWSRAWGMVGQRALESGRGTLRGESQPRRSVVVMLKQVAFIATKVQFFFPVP